jgi:uncharacterized membrane protein
MRKWLPLLLIAADVAFVLMVYDQLPARVAVHFGLNGPNGWSGREQAAWLLPAIAAGSWLLLRALPLIDPRRENYAKFQSAYDTLVLALVAVLVVVHVALLGFALGWPVRVEQVVPIAIGMLFVVIGTLLPKSRATWFFGIRTPWTLSSDEVWERTHRVAGITMVIAGLLLMSLALTRSRVVLGAVVVGIFLLTLYPVIYSYFAWRDVQRRVAPPTGGG